MRRLLISGLGANGMTGSQPWKKVAFLVKSVGPSPFFFEKKKKGKKDDLKTSAPAGSRPGPQKLCVTPAGPQRRRRGWRFRQTGPWSPTSPFSFPSLPRVMPLCPPGHPGEEEPPSRNAGEGKAEARGWHRPGSGATPARRARSPPVGAPQGPALPFRRAAVGRFKNIHI